MAITYALIVAWAEKKCNLGRNTFSIKIGRARMRGGGGLTGGWYTTILNEIRDGIFLREIRWQQWEDFEEQHGSHNVFETILIYNCEWMTAILKGNNIKHDNQEMKTEAGQRRIK